MFWPKYILVVSSLRALFVYFAAYDARLCLLVSLYVCPSLPRGMSAQSLVDDVESVSVNTPHVRRVSVHCSLSIVLVLIKCMFFIIRCCYFVCFYNIIFLSLYHRGRVVNYPVRM